MARPRGREASQHLGSLSRLACTLALRGGAGLNSCWPTYDFAAGVRFLCPTLVTRRTRNTPIAMPTTARTVVAEPDPRAVVAGGEVAALVTELVVELVSVELRDRVDSVVELVTSLFVDAELVAEVLAGDDVVVPDATAPPRPWLGPTTMKIEDELAR
jgi:hypothetical protein